MKIRKGFVSNSSSSSFTIPSSFLTDEQKEVVFSCLFDGRDVKKKLNEKLDFNYTDKEIYPEKGLPVNKEYHQIFQDMLKNDEWNDWDWSSGYFHDEEFIGGSCSMWNGSLGIFFDRIGIDITALEIINHGHYGVHMPSHSEALKMFAELREDAIACRKKLKEECDLLPEDEQFSHDFNLFHHGELITDNPYSMSDDDFNLLGDSSLTFDSDDGYSYWKDLGKML